MKKGFFLLLLVVAIAAFYLYNRPPSLTEELTITAPTSTDLLLINDAHPYTGKPTHLKMLPRDLAPNVRIQHDFYVEQALLEPLQQLFDDAMQHGINHFMINSAYRSQQAQKSLYDKYGAGHALKPGHSEHESGLSLDIGSSLGKMEQAEEGIWLSNNAHRFGFIVRYPADKVDVTGISFEPWHIRYVGLPHSVFMHNKKLAFEQYVQLLQDEQSYHMRVNGVRYFVQYTTDTTLFIPDANTTSISATNEGGYIITSTY